MSRKLWFQCILGLFVGVFTESFCAWPNTIQQGEVWVSATYITPCYPDSCSMDIQISNSLNSPATLVLAFLLTHNSAENLPKNDTNASTFQVIPKLAQPLIESGFEMQHAFYDGSNGEEYCQVLIIVIYNKQKIAMSPSATVCSLRFVPTGEKSPTIKLIEGNKPVIIDKGTFFSTAADPDATPIAVRSHDFPESVICQKPLAPRNISATKNVWGRIDISWQSSNEGGIYEYRLYRSSDPDLSRAYPLGEGWQKVLFYRDRDLSCSNTTTKIFQRQYYYWLKTRDTVTRCESDFSTPPVLGRAIGLFLPPLSCIGDNKNMK